MLVGIYIVLYLLGNAYDYVSCQYLGKCKKICTYDLDGYMYANGGIDLSKLKKPIIFIHLPHDRNVNSWQSFGSPKTNHLDHSLSYLSIKSIIEQCGNYFEIVIFDNNNVKDILAEENVSNVCNIENPNSTLSDDKLKYWEEYVRLKILYKYGGTVIRPYFIFNKCPSYSVFNPKQFTCSKFVNNQHVSNSPLIVNTSNFMAFCKHNQVMNDLINQFESNEVVQLAHILTSILND